MSINSPSYVVRIYVCAENGDAFTPARQIKSFETVALKWCHTTKNRHARREAFQFARAINGLLVRVFVEQINLLKTVRRWEVK